MQDRPTKLEEYQTYIDGKWSGRLRQGVPDLRPLHRRAVGADPGVRCQGRRPRLRGGLRAFDRGPWPAMTQTARGKVLRRIAGLIEKHAEHLARSRCATTAS